MKDKQRSNEIKKFAERLKVEVSMKERPCCREYDIGYNTGYSEAQFDFCNLVDKLLKEFLNE